jgi:hypothetical protein
MLLMDPALNLLFLRVVRSANSISLLVMKAAVDRRMMLILDAWLRSGMML